ncbi:hypothetical protein OB919_18035 [Halobacteria archaeon AArc-curdl1]|uniref:Uncharacterized protein n=1 Tax=Natronosalvus hydrolyticus TaxID=2979988 RepID=A0AAP2ZAW4_9EURY|nr:hypothetical protein [Halobacteria archaeon AArc-curdl1]
MRPEDSRKRSWKRNSEDNVQIWWFDTEAANRGELIALVAAALYVISAVLPQARLCTEEMIHRELLGCQGDEITVWLAPSVVISAALAAAIVVLGVYLSQHPPEVFQPWNPKTSTILLVTAVLSLVVASTGAPRGDLLELLVGTWVQVAASTILFFYGISSRLLEIYATTEG